MTSSPIAWPDLRGRVVVVVFWSFGCEASLVRLRQVDEIRRRAAAPPGGMVIIAVHTPRFGYEADIDAVRSAAAQHRLTFPVVHDPDRITWDRYNPGGWPATYVIDPDSIAIGAQLGVGGADLLADAVAAAADPDAAATPALGSGHVRATATTPDPVDASSLPAGGLAFPTSVAPLSDGRLVVVDGGHDRLLILALDDDLSSASVIDELEGFHQPHSVATEPSGGIYVSEPSDGRVTFVEPAGVRHMLTSDLVSPTGLTVDADGSLVVADSGADLLYRIAGTDTGDIVLGVIAGSGLTGRRGGDGAQVELAQPTGLCRTRRGIVFCDGASNSIRRLGSSGQVSTITAGRFTAWGLADGYARRARFQRPSAVTATADGTLIVADTGNHRLRCLTGRKVRALGLTGLTRPEGLCTLPSGHLVVADTGNHRLVVVDLTSRTAWPLRIRAALPAPAPDRN